MMLIILHRKQMARETFALKFCFLLFYCINFLSSAKSECNSNAICQPLGDCAELKERTNINYRLLPWCNINQRTVCCQQINLNIPAPPRENENRIFARECEKYQRIVYPKCRVERLISGGQNAELKEFPHMALVGLYKDSRYDWFCGGALISPRFVLTAAHCILVQGGIVPNRVRLGELDYNSTSDGAQVREFEVKSYTVHPNYSVRLEYFDIALIELNGVATLNEYVAPICLPSNNGSALKQLYAAGWGLTQFAGQKASHLQKVTIDKIGDKSCVQSAGRDLSRLPRGLNVTSQFCAGSTIDDRDTCQGDSGGPVFFEHDYRPCMFEIHGITSFGTVCGHLEPGVYTRVLPYIDWIESIVWPEGGDRK